jgi:hypothetical protein
MTDEELEVAIATYRVELIEERGMARGDLDELEDHLRALVAELRAAGLSAQIAFVEATRRLGQPHALAREFAHTRPVFGARPSRAAAWSVVALQVVGFVLSWITAAAYDVRVAIWWSPATMMTLVATVGLAFRTSWARAMFLATAALGLLGSVELLVTLDDVPARYFLPGIAFDVGVLAFLAPARGRGLTARGWALALALAGTGAVSGVNSVLISPLGDGVIAPYLFGIAGILLCARWATPALIAVAAVLVAATPYLQVGASSNPHTAVNFAWHFVSTGAVIAAALLARRGARGAGSLRALAR